MPDVRSDSTIEAAPVGGSDPGAAGGPMLTLRPRLAFRSAGPILIVLGLGGLVAGFPAAALLALVGFIALVAWMPRVSVDDRELRIRGVVRTETIPLATTDEVRLRRVPIGPKRPARRNYRFGRFCSIPLRLRVMQNETTLFQITVVFWEGWPKLARYLLSIPTMESDGRTRGRLDRYG
jgi:hypothetical protein